MKLCKHCKSSIGNRKKDAKFCSESCRMQYHKQKWVGYNAIHGTQLSSVQIGAIAEARVVADLVHQGYDVYKGLWDTPADYVIIKDNEKKTVQVKTGNIKNDKLHYGADRHYSDILAIFNPLTGQILYVPRETRELSP